MVSAVAAVATAVPAFLGYTEDATLADTPTRIASLLEFEEHSVEVGGTARLLVHTGLTEQQMVQRRVRKHHA